MKYLALLSGGKDSCFNLLHCHANGHELVAAASLRPPEGLEEIDSFMYQTVGQDAIQLVADALQVPLYRGTILGSAIEKGLEYGSRSSSGPQKVDGDETEDLFELISRAKAAHPEIEAVSVGAILSNYQRVRVEHICNRLSLTALCYLWRRPQTDLLSEMIACGLKAIVIKVAGIGLTSKHLGLTLEQIQPYLLELNNLYGSHVCGEGGEYESFTLDCPLFKQQIQLKDSEIVIHSDNDFASVYYLRVKDGSLVPKPVSGPRDVVFRLGVHPPSLLDSFGVDVYRIVSSSSSSSIPFSDVASGNKHAELDDDTVTCHALYNWACISNVHKPAHLGALTVEHQLIHCFTIIREYLRNHHLQLEDIAFVTILLSSMDLFQRMNIIYKSFFGSAPPARACIAVDLPLGQDVLMEIIANSSRNEKNQAPKRHSLHVQSLSYWAPANIGPYSQAISVDNQTFVSGQIGLMPASNSIPEPTSLAIEAALSLQHTHRIRETFRTQHSKTPVVQGSVVWLARLDDIATLLEVWNPRNSINNDDFLLRSPTLFVVVKALPKNALVEVQTLLHNAMIQLPDQENEGFFCDTPINVILKYGDRDPIQTTSSQSHFYWEMASSSEASMIFAVIFFDNVNEDSSDILSQLGLISPSVSLLSIHFFFTTRPAEGFEILVHKSHGARLPVTKIRARHLLDRMKSSWTYAATVHAIKSHD